MRRITSSLKGLLRLLAVTVTGLSIAPTVVAQIPPPDTSVPQMSPYPTCQPPSPGEYLLLVKSNNAEAQDKVRQTLPSSAKSTVCSYLDDVVTRVSGFTTVDTANSWAKYLNDSGLSAFVARPSQSSVAVPPISAQPTAASTPATTSPTPAKPPTAKSPAQAVATSRIPSTYSPKPLGAGYAVLVNYFNRPELAQQIHQLLGKEIGLVSYGQRPYLLAVHTTDQASANVILHKLTDRGFWAMVVDSRRVTLLRQPVNLQQSTAQN